MIDILLPTYNGSKYLDKQIKSLFSQTITDWRLLIRDDGSTDSTISLIKEYAERYHEKVVLIQDDYGNLRTSGCLNKMLPYIKGEYFMYCDQDDIWEPCKIERSMQEMNKLEEEYPNKPLLVCSDATLIDGNDNIIGDSFFESQGFRDNVDNYYKILALNCVQGSTSLMNRRVLDYMKYIPNTIGHDGWTASIVSYYGKIKYIHEPLLRYRQHDGNVLGAYNVNRNYLINSIKRIKQMYPKYAEVVRLTPFKVNPFIWWYYKIYYNIIRFIEAK